MYSLTLNTQLDPIDIQLNTLAITIPRIEERKVTAPSNTLQEPQEFRTYAKTNALRKNIITYILQPTITFLISKFKYNFPHIY